MATEKEVEAQTSKITDLKKTLADAEVLRQKMKQKKQELDTSKGILDSNLYFIIEHSQAVSLTEYRKIKLSHSSIEKQLKELSVEIEKLNGAIEAQKKNIEKETELLARMEHQVKNKVIPFRSRDAEKHSRNQTTNRNR